MIAIGFVFYIIFYAFYRAVEEGLIQLSNLGNIMHIMIGATGAILMIAGVATWLWEIAP